MSYEELLKYHHLTVEDIVKKAMGMRLYKQELKRKPANGSFAHSTLTKLIDKEPTKQ